MNLFDCYGRIKFRKSHDLGVPSPENSIRLRSAKNDSGDGSVIVLPSCGIE